MFKIIIEEHNIDIPINVGKSFVHPVSGITYPSNWTKLPSGTKDELGIVEILDTPKPTIWDIRHLEDRLEFEEDGVTPKLDTEGNQLVTEGLKSIWKDKVDTQLGYYLGLTDYRITKASELNILVGIETLHLRYNIRQEAANKKLAIDTSTSKEVLKAYVESLDYQTWPKEGALEGKYVPNIITKRQAFDLMKVMEIDDGTGNMVKLKTAVINFINTSGDEDLQDDFNNTIEFDRKDSAIESMRVAFDWTQDQMDDFFITAYGM